MDSPQLTELLVQARAGSSAALGQLLEAFRPYLLGIANQELDPGLRVKGGASDLVQETFVAALRDLAGFRGQSEGELLAWLRQILLHSVANTVRRYNGTLKRQRAVEIPIDNSSRRELKNGLAGDHPSLSDLFVQDEQLERLRASLLQLPSPYREVVIWRSLEGQSFAEIARKLNRTEKNAQKIWSRAIRVLQKQLSSPS